MKKLGTMEITRSCNKYWGGQKYTWAFINVFTSKVTWKYDLDTGRSNNIHTIFIKQILNLKKKIIIFNFL